MIKKTKTAIGLLLALAATLPDLGRAAPAEEDAELLAAPPPDSAMSLKLSGFADFRWIRFDHNGDPRWALRGVPENSSFSVGNLNLYLDGRLDQSFRSLVEVRFSYLPGGVGLQGQSSPLDTGKTGLFTGTTVYDYAQLRATAQWGGIVIERAWLEYRLDQAFTLRGGQFLTPYGVWNVDHGSPTLIDIAPPFPVGQELLPKSQVGLEAYGSVFVGDSRLGYHATVSNGRIGSNPQFLDFDKNVAVGGRLFVETGGFGELRLGTSAYYGKYTDVRQGLVYQGKDIPLGGTTLTVPLFLESKALMTGQELDLAADLRWDIGGLTVIGEYMEQRRSKEQKTVSTRATATTWDVQPETQADFVKRGWYGLVGYRLPGAVMPFGMIEYISDVRGDWKYDPLQESYAWVAGLNWRVRPNVVLKASYTYAWFPRAPKSLETKDPLKWVATQAAWAF